MTSRRVFLLLLLVIVAACAPNTPTPSAVPTLTLIPPTATVTPSPIPPTSTNSNLPAPADLNTPVAAATLPVPPANLTGEALIDQDPVAESLTLIAERLVAKQTNLPSSLVKIVDVRTMVWTDSTLNCPQAGSQAVPTQTDGYRILLSAGAQEFLFHTDVDRVLPCAQANEQLPEGVTLPPEAIARNSINAAVATSESTAQATPEATATSKP